MLSDARNRRAMARAEARRLEPLEDSVECPCTRDGDGIEPCPICGGSERISRNLARELVREAETDRRYSERQDDKETR